MNILRYAFKNISRNLSLSLSSVLIIALLIFFVNILLFVVYASEQFIASVNDRIAITVNFQDGYTDAQVRSQEFLSGAVQTLSGVRVEYISQQQAFHILQQRSPDLAALVENIDDNPLPNSVRFSNVPIALYGQVNEYISQYRDILQYDESSMQTKLVDYQTQYNQIVGVVNSLKSLNMAVYVLIGLFLFTVFIVVHMVIRNFIFFLQDEIRIIELVGGKGSFIYGPFIVQGIVYMIVATLLALLVFSSFREMGQFFSAVLQFFGIHHLLPGFSGVDMIPAAFQPTFEAFHQILLHQYFGVELLVATSIGALSAAMASLSYIHSTIRKQ